MKDGKEHMLFPTKAVQEIAQFLNNEIKTSIAVKQRRKRHVLLNISGIDSSPLSHYSAMTLDGGTCFSQKDPKCLYLNKVLQAFVSEGHIFSFRYYDDYSVCPHCDFQGLEFYHIQC